MRTAELLVDQKCKLGEGPIWITKQGRLFYVDILAHKIHSCNHLGQEEKVFKMPTYVSNIYESQNENQLLVALADGLYLLDVSTGELNVYALFNKVDPALRTNDGFCDPYGNAWIGTMALTEEEGLGDLWMLDVEKQWHLMLPHTSISNGIRSTPDGNEIYYIDTPTHQVRRFNYNHNNRTWALDKVVFEIDPSVGHPDGMAIDENGHLWIALWDGFAVICVDPETGEIIDKVNVPAPHVSACTFGGPELKTLLITTARKDMTADELEEFPHAGGIFKVDLEVKGRPNFVFRPK